MSTTGVTYLTTFNRHGTEADEADEADAADVRQIGRTDFVCCLSAGSLSVVTCVTFLSLG